MDDVMSSCGKSLAGVHCISAPNTAFFFFVLPHLYEHFTHWSLLTRKLCAQYNSKCRKSKTQISDAINLVNMLFKDRCNG